jgi:hypothetical protein
MAKGIFSQKTPLMEKRTMDLQKLRKLAALGDKDAAKSLLREASRKGDHDLEGIALSILLGDLGKEFHETRAQECRHSEFLAPLWDNRRILAWTGFIDYQGVSSVFSWDPQLKLFCIHDWVWGSCEMCDPWEHRLYNYEESDPEVEEAKIRQEVETSALLSTLQEIKGVARRGKKEIHLCINYLLNQGPYPPKGDMDEFELYAHPQDLGYPRPLTTEESQIRENNEANRTTFSFSDLLEKLS